MTASFLNRSVAIIRLTATLGAIGIACGSCSEQYLARRDSLAPGTGDAVQANIAAQVIDPWPPHAQTTNLMINGQRAQHAMENFRNPSSVNAPAAPAPASTPTGVNSAGASRNY